MGVSGSDLDASQALLAVRAAMASVRNYLDQLITFVANDSVRFDGSGTRVLRIKERPIRRIDSVVVNAGDDDEETVAATAYFLRDSLLIRDDDDVWPRGLGNVTVQYDHGWDVTGSSDSESLFIPIPADITLVTLSAARRTYVNAGEEGQAVTGATSYSIGAYSESHGSEEGGVAASAGVTLITAEKNVLDTYKVRGFRSSGGGNA